MGTRTRTRDLSNVDGVVVVEENERTTSEAYSANGRYRYLIGSRLLIFTGAGWLSDRFAGVDDRFTGSLGLGYAVRDSEKETLLLEFGGDVTSEHQPSGRKTFPGGRADMTYRRSLGPTSRFDLNIEILPNLQDLDDLRTNVELALTSTLMEKLALKLTYVFLFDNRPATVLVRSPGLPDAVFEFDKIDTRTAASLVVNF